MKAMYSNGMLRYEYLCKAISFAPYDTMLRTHATIITADYAPVIANIHALRMIEHFDGQITMWATFYNYALAWLKGYSNFFDVMTFYLKQGHYVLPYFNPINKLLTGRDSISLKSQYIGGAKMRAVAEAQLWKIRAFISNMENANKDTIILNQEGEKLQLRIQNSQQKLQLAQANIENLVLYEKKRMGIPDGWIFNADEGMFKDPGEMTEEERKKCGLEG